VGYWPWIAAVLAVGWLLTLALWLGGRMRSGTTVSAKRATPPPPRTAQARARVRNACRANDPKAARDALLAWAAARWPEDPPRRLQTLAARLDRSGAEVLGELDRRLYGTGGRLWDGAFAWERLVTAMGPSGERRTAKTRSALPDLYPQRA
jgi:hypothetical protein